MSRPPGLTRGPAARCWRRAAPQSRWTCASPTSMTCTARWQRRRHMLHEAAHRTGALIRHNTLLMLREPGPLASRMILPLAFLILLHPLYEQAQGAGRGVAQAVLATLVTFSMLAMSIVGSPLLTDRILPP